MVFLLIGRHGSCLAGDTQVRGGLLAGIGCCCVGLPLSTAFAQVAVDLLHARCGQGVEDEDERAEEGHGGWYVAHQVAQPVEGSRALGDMRPRVKLVGHVAECGQQPQRARTAEGRTEFLGH